MLPSVQHLSYTLVGPKMSLVTVNKRSAKLETCEDCDRRGRTRTQDLIPSKYEHVNITTPDLAVAFNCGAHDGDSWIPALQKLVRQGAPFVLTSFNRDEAQQDVDTLRNAVDTVVNVAWEVELCPFRIEHLSFDYLAGEDDHFYSDNSWWLGVRGLSQQQ